MARIDKYDPISGGHRGLLAANVAAHDGVIGGATAPVGCGLDANGRIVVGAGQTGIKGVLCLPRAMKAGQAVDLMTAGEIVDIGGTAGTNYYANPVSGAIVADTPDTASTNEVQTLTRTSTGGTVTLTFNGQTTGTIPADATNFTAAATQTALRALAGVDAADVTVTGSAGGPLTVTFSGKFAGVNVPIITVDNTLATGGTVTVAETTPGAGAEGVYVGYTVEAGRLVVRV